MPISNFFRVIYSWFRDFYGSYLYDYFKGWNCQTQDFSNPNQFFPIGLIALAISLVVVLFYYYGINHPRFNRWWSWLIMLFVTALTALFFGFGKAYSHLYGGQIGDCLLYIIGYDNNGQEISRTQQIFTSNCWGFGFANMIVAILFFIFFSFCFKWGSRNCKHSPCF